MKNPEQEARNTLDALRGRLLAAQARGDDAAVHRINLALAEPLGQLAESSARTFDFDAAENYLQDLERLVNHLAEGAEPQASRAAEAGLVRAQAAVSEFRGIHALFGQLDFSGGDIELDRAEKLHERAAAVEIEHPRDQRSARMARGLALRARGLRLYGEARSAIEAAEGDAAEELLKSAAELFTDAALVLKPSISVDAADVHCPAHPAYCESFAALAGAYRSRASADTLAFRGNPDATADHLHGHILGLRQARHHLLGLSGEFAELISRRIDLEADLAEKRRQRFESLRGTRIDQPTVLATLLFGLMTLAALLLQMWGGDYFALKARFPLFHAMALALAVLVGGIVTGLAAWGDGTAFFREILGIFRTRNKQDGPREDR
jgi:hypothetical protein